MRFAIPIILCGVLLEPSFADDAEQVKAPAPEWMIDGLLSAFEDRETGVHAEAAVCIFSFPFSFDLPYNDLHEQGYPSVGCTHCTRAVAGSTPSEYTRLGRWSGSEKTECGLHLTS